MKERFAKSIKRIGLAALIVAAGSVAAIEQIYSRQDDFSGRDRYGQFSEKYQTAGVRTRFGPGMEMNRFGMYLTMRQQCPESMGGKCKHVDKSDRVFGFVPYGPMSSMVADYVR